MDHFDEAKIWTQIAKMNKDQLDRTIGAVKTRQKTLAYEMSNTFKVGDKVMFGKATGPAHFGTVYKINRSKAVVDTGQDRKWTVPFSMMQFAK
tara:strand:+ start:283 stop:561 length:279 start_codon:yes stop_codon:yes gene_type:complete